MKLAQKGLPFVIALLLMAVCLLTVGLASLFLPDYKGTVEEMEQPKNANLLYVNSTEELNLYPWNLYSESEKVITDFEPEVYELAVGCVYYLAGYTGSIEKLHSQMRLQESEQSGLYFLKDIKLTDENGTQYAVNIAYRSANVCYFSCINENEPEITPDEMDQALRKLQKDWEDFVELMKPVEVRDLEARRQMEIDSYGQRLMWEKSGDAFSGFLLRHQDLVDSQKGYLADNTSWLCTLITNAQFTSLSYDNHIYLMCTASDGTSLVLIYSPIEERFVGFSLK